MASAAVNDSVMVLLYFEGSRDPPHQSPYGTFAVQLGDLRRGELVESDYGPVLIHNALPAFHGFSPPDLGPCTIALDGR